MKMEMDAVKLGRLIKTCRESGVKSLCLDEGNVTIYFFDELVKTKQSEEIEINQFVDAVINQPEPVAQEINNDDVDSMLHLTDPAAWEREQMDEYSPRSVADGGDQYEEDLEDA